MSVCGRRPSLLLLEAYHLTLLSWIVKTTSWVLRKAFSHIVNIVVIQLNYPYLFYHLIRAVSPCLEPHKSKRNAQLYTELIIEVLIRFCIRLLQ
jgi:hypothetical protein